MIEKPSTRDKVSFLDAILVSWFDGYHSYFLFLFDSLRFLIFSKKNSFPPFLFLPVSNWLWRRFPFIFFPRLFLVPRIVDNLGSAPVVPVKYFSLFPDTKCTRLLKFHTSPQTWAKCTEVGYSNWPMSWIAGHE